MRKSPKILISVLFGKIVRWITIRNAGLGKIILRYLPGFLKNFETQVVYNGVKLQVFTGESHGKRIYYFNNFEQDKIHFFKSLVKPGMLIYDIGANLGVYSLIAAKQGARVVAFEPAPDVAAMLRRNIVLNKLPSKITVVEEAVSDREMIGKLYLHKPSNLGVSRVFDFDNSGNDNYGIIDIKMNNLDNYEKIYGKPSLVKIDIEGAETLAVKGGRELLKKDDAPMLLIEFHPAEIAFLGSSMEEIIIFLGQCNYSKYELPKLTPQNHFWYFFSKKPVAM